MVTTCAEVTRIGRLLRNAMLCIQRPTMMSIPGAPGKAINNKFGGPFHTFACVGTTTSAAVLAPIGEHVGDTD